MKYAQLIIVQIIRQFENVNQKIKHFNKPQGTAHKVEKNIGELKVALAAVRVLQIGDIIKNSLGVAKIDFFLFFGRTRFTFFTATQ